MKNVCRYVGASIVNFISQERRKIRTNSDSLAEIDILAVEEHVLGEVDRQARAGLGGFAAVEGFVARHFHRARAKNVGGVQDPLELRQILSREDDVDLRYIRLNGLASSRRVFTLRYVYSYSEQGFQ